MPIARIVVARQKRRTRASSRSTAAGGQAGPTAGPAPARPRLCLVELPNGADDAAPAPPQLPAPPAYLTSFVGRERDLDLVGGLLADPRVRLVTVTGPGGVGKTRLAVMAAGACDAPVGFVPLAAVRSEDLVVPAIASAMGSGERPESAPRDRVVAAVGGRPVVLVLDNLEHLTACGPDLLDLLAVCPWLTLLVTSRSPLRLSGEHLVAASPLALPERGRTGGWAGWRTNDLAAVESVRLFVERARATDPRFALTDENAPIVADICERLGGLPLAIELAAARAAVLPPADLLARLARQLPLLSGGPRDLPARLRSMRDAVAWSHHLLGEPARRLFRRLAVFPDGVPLDAVVRMVGLDLSSRTASPVAGTLDANALDLIGELIDAGLAHRVDRDGEAARFAMLEPIREFAWEQLDDSGETDAAFRVLIDWLLDRTESNDWWRSFAVGPNDTGWFASWEREIVNVRAALVWAETAGLADPLLRLAGALFLFWWGRGGERLAEGRGWIERGLALPGSSDPRARAFALAVASALAHRQDDNERAAEYARASGAAWRSIDERVGEGYAAYLLGIARYRQGRVTDAGRHYAEAVTTLRSAGKAAMAAEALVGVAQVERDLGRLAISAARFQEALAVQEAEGIAWGAALSRYGYATVVQIGGDLGRALGNYRESLAYWRQIRDWGSVAVCLEGIASACCAGGDPRTAALLFGASESLRQSAATPIPCRAVASYGAALADIRTRLGAAEFAEAWLDGWRLSPDEAVAVGRRARASAPRPRPAAARTGPCGLSRREHEVLRLVAAGLTDREIAERLSIGRRTASDHVGHILRKLGLRSRADAAAFAVRNALA